MTDVVTSGAGGGQLRAYYRLAKPGIIYGNLLSAAAGFALAARWRWDAAQCGRFAALLVGLGLVIGSACVLNNVIDRRLDARMSRTRQRALVTGAITPRAALAYAAALGLVGAGALAWATTALALAAALAGLIGYVLIYTPAKRRTAAATLIGSLPGAVPPVVGYTAVTGRLDPAAGLLFAALVLWQMPHFYAIALYRRADYAAAAVPVLPIVRGAGTTKRRILAYIAAFTLVTPLLTFFGYTTWLFAAVMLVLDGAWLVIGLTARGSVEHWGRVMFRYSLIVLLAFCLLIAATPRA